jgi:serine/threonine protein kinase
VSRANLNKRKMKNCTQFTFVCRHMVLYPEGQACFYAAQVVLALEYLHYLSESTVMNVLFLTIAFRPIVDIIYRNVKPEDILFGMDGYLKLTDFGFAKVVQGRTYTLCGTPEVALLICSAHHSLMHHPHTVVYRTRNRVRNWP